MRFLHSMIRVLDLEKSIHFYRDLLGLQLIRQKQSEKGRYTLAFFSEAPGSPAIELTHNWDEKTPYTRGRNFGHLAFEVDEIYKTCEFLQKSGVPILRPPRDGYMAFIKDPDGISIELLQKGDPLPPQEPWLSMPNEGSW